jgi:hypothetical protein
MCFQGSYVIVIRTHKKFQVVTFQWPRSKVHLSKYFKMFLMVLPHSENSLFDNSFSWSAINLEEILQGTMSSSDDFNVIFKQKNVALLQQMSRFDNSCFIKIASCKFDLNGYDDAENKNGTKSGLMEPVPYENDAETTGGLSS